MQTLEPSRVDEIAEILASASREGKSVLTLSDVKRIADLARKRGEVEILALSHRFRYGDAQLGAARALRLELELVDARKLGGANP